MSIMVLKEESISGLIEGLCKIPQMWNSGRFIEHSNEGRLYSDSTEEFILSCYIANITSYNNRYNEELTLTFDELPKSKPFNIYQTLKTLQCLQYNIEAEYCPQSEKIINQLNMMVNEIKSIIIESIPEYKSAIWG